MNPRSSPVSHRLFSYALFLLYFCIGKVSIHFFQLQQYFSAHIMISSPEIKFLSNLALCFCQHISFREIISISGNSIHQILYRIRLKFQILRLLLFCFLRLFRFFILSFFYPFPPFSFPSLFLPFSLPVFSAVP